jgi:hypothetical protein
MRHETLREGLTLLVVIQDRLQRSILPSSISTLTVSIFMRTIVLLLHVNRRVQERGIVEDKCA